MAILTMARHRFYKNDGSLNAGGKVYSYVAGTTTPTATYTSSDASTPNANPIILDSKGECDLWVTGQIKLNVLESDNTQVTGWPVDNVGSGVSVNDATMRWAGTAAGTANALAITPSPAISAYVIGQSFIFKAGASPNSAATTVAISGLSAIAVQISGSALAGGEILADKWYSIVLDSLTTCQITPVASAALNGNASQAFSVAAATAAAHAVRADQFKSGQVSVAALVNTPTAGKITFTLNPCILDFRSSTLSHGVPSTKFVTSALTLATDNIGASFGATTGVQTRLFLLAIDDGTATPRLGVTLGSSLLLYETNVLTATTAITGAVTSASAVYTTSALGAGAYPYKVVGAVDATWTAGSGWVSLPALVQGDDPSLFDYSGTWTPNVGGNATYTTQSGTFERKGNRVFVDCTMVINTIGTGSTTTVSGLPFTSANNGQVFYGVSATGNCATAIVSECAQILPNTTTINVAGRTVASASVTDITAFGSGTTFRCSVNYLLL